MRMRVDETRWREQKGNTREKNAQTRVEIITSTCLLSLFVHFSSSRKMRTSCESDLNVFHVLAKSSFCAPLRFTREHALLVLSIAEIRIIIFYQNLHFSSFSPLKLCPPFIFLSGLQNTISLCFLRPLPY